MKEIKRVYQVPSVEKLIFFLEEEFMTGSLHENNTGVTEGEWETGGDSEYEEIL